MRTNQATCTHVHTSEHVASAIKDREREIPILINLLAGAVAETNAFRHAIQTRLSCIGKQIELPVLEDPYPICMTSLGEELKELVVQLRTTNQHFAGMLDGLEI